MHANRADDLCDVARSFGTVITWNKVINPLWVAFLFRKYVLVFYVPPQQWNVADYFDGLVQERRNSSVLAMELRLSSCINPSIYSQGKQEHLYHTVSIIRLMSAQYWFIMACLHASDCKNEYEHTFLTIPIWCYKSVTMAIFPRCTWSAFRELR